MYPTFSLPSSFLSGITNRCAHKLPESFEIPYWMHATAILNIVDLLMETLMTLATKGSLHAIKCVPLKFLTFRKCWQNVIKTRSLLCRPLGHSHPIWQQTLGKNPPIYLKRRQRFLRSLALILTSCRANIKQV